MEPNLKNKTLRVIRTIKMYLNITGLGKMDFFFLAAGNVNNRSPIL